MVFIGYFLVLLASQVLAKVRRDVAFNDEGFMKQHLRPIVGGSESIIPPDDDPVVYVTAPDHLSVVQGTREGQYPNSYYRFYGLRYAEPPVGKNRFQRPRKLPLKGFFKAVKPGAPCPQPHPDDPNKVTGSEDCLFLNVFTPKLPTTDDLLPVLLWIHGGGFRRGSANQYGGGYLARRDVVVVTVQYRLGSLGFMSTKDKNMPGNMALFDMATALDWVKQYIYFFGGNSSNIVTMGQGTGASSAVMLGLSNITQNHLQGIIAMSGSAVSPFAIEPDPMETTKKLASKSNCPEHPTFELVKCLQQLSPEKLLSADSWLEENALSTNGYVHGLSGLLTPAPIVEGEDDRRFLPSALQESPSTSFELQHIPKVPLFTGVTKHETAGVITGSAANEMMDKIKNIPNFIDQVLVKNLLSLSGRGLLRQVEKQKEVLKKLTNNYLKLRIPGSDVDSITSAFNQIIEVTSDAFFNFPAVLTSDYWKKNNIPSYFYSFDHVGKMKGSEELLKGSVFHKDGTASDVPVASHGSELPYLFDVRSLEGVPHPEQNESTVLSPEDSKVRDLLTSMISDFAKQKSFGVNGAKAASFPSFISIQPTPKVESNFRECQMSLWKGDGNPVANQVCETVGAISSKVLGGVKDVASATLGKLTPPKTPTVIKNVFGKIG